MSFRRFFSAKTSQQGSRESRRRGQRNRRNLVIQHTEARCMMAADGLDFCTFDQIDPSVGRVAAEVATGQSVNDAQAVDRPQPVLLVLSNQDFWYQDYFDTRTALEEQGLEVVVAAADRGIAKPHANSGQGRGDGLVQPDLAISDADASDYSGIVFVGGWGMSSYQYAFEGTYDNSAYNGSLNTKQVVNDLINDFVDQDKHVAAVCYGVSVLAYARVDGQSLIKGRDVAGFNGPAPSAHGIWQSSRGQIESNGARMFRSAELGDPATSADDVWIDGKIITAENYDSARAFGRIVGENILAAHEKSDGGDSTDRPTEPEQPKPVLMVIANQDFYHREYFETRESLESAGLNVVVAAATTDTAIPHAISVVDGREPNVTPDLALANVDANDYSAIVFVGGYGAASYQYANSSTYDHSVYEGDPLVQSIVNDLINDFVDQDKYLAAICNGVTVLAWSRIDGVSPIDGHTVSSWAENLPSADGGQVQVTRHQIEANGAVQVASGSIGDPDTATDDVIVDGKIITAENYDSAYAFGAMIAEQLIAATKPSDATASDAAIMDLVGKF